MQSAKLQLKGRGEMLSGKKQIYIVDDDESVRRALKLLLVTYDFQVETFNSAEKFLVLCPIAFRGV